MKGKKPWLIISAYVVFKMWWAGISTKLLDYINQQKNHAGRPVQLVHQQDQPGPA